jgi:DNA-binding transcriptional LysR family regulator
MEIMQLATFVAVADTGTFTAAGRVRHIGQSAVSASIATLEGVVGARLFERTRSAAVLTAAGRALLPHARSMLAEQRSAMDAVAQAEGRLVGEVRLGVLATSGRIDLARVVLGLRRDYPDVTVSMVQSMTGSQGNIELVRTGRLELALAASNGAPPRGVDTTTLTTEPMLALLPATDPLASRATITVADISQRPYLALPAGWSARSLVDEAWRPEGSPVVQVSDYGVLAELVAAEMGVAVIPAFAMPDRSDVVGVPTELTWELMLVRPRRPIASATDVVARTIVSIAEQID